MQRSHSSLYNMCHTLIMEADIQKKNPSLEEIQTFFLTPPSSDECLLPNKCISRVDRKVKSDSDKPTFSLSDDEEDVFKIIDVSPCVDILKECYSRSLVGTVCNKILSNLSEKELLRASHVNKTWRTIIRYEDMRSGRKLSRYIRKMKTSYSRDKENIDARKKSETNENKKESISTPLIDTSNIMKCKQKDDSVFTTPCTPVSSKASYKQCPQCQTPSKTSKLCGYCSKCNDKFCTYCFYTNDKHSPTCRIVGGSGVTCSPRKLSSASRRYSIGSKENKSRLKRI